MCGITGIAAFRDASEPTMEQLAAMCQTLVHRGPDDEGKDIREGVALGMRRLAIIDLAGGNQPIFNEDRSVRVVFNGEVYNFRELRRDLEAKGRKFVTQSDTEVIVQGYLEYGVEIPKYLSGMFAFALHDSRRQKLLVARDHMGIKPFYYAFDGHHFVFGSEIKAVLASGLVQRGIDMGALSEFLAWEYVPGEKTLFNEVRKLLPGHLIDIDLQTRRCTPTCFWDIPEADQSMQKRTAEEWVDAVEQKVQQCVRRQLVSDVPLGAFLSGGTDSSLVVSSMPDAKAFSIGFDDPSYNELRYAKEVAKHLNVQHTHEVIQPDVVEHFDKLMYFMDDPIADFSIFPTYLVSRLTRQHVTVALSGDGGDELFGGYETYSADQYARLYQHLPRVLHDKLIAPLVKQLRPSPAKKGLVNKLKRFVEGLEFPQELSHARWRIFLADSMRNGLLTGDALGALESPAGEHITRLFQQAGNRDVLDRSLYVDVKSYLTDNCLVKLDRMSMAVSLESRVPMLDRELVELAFSVPADLKLRQGESKWLLKQVAARRIPKHCIYRPKQGFSIPIKHWLKTQFKPLMEQLLDPRRIQSEGIFHGQVIESLKQEHLAGRANHSHILWSLMVFHAWQDRWGRA